MIHAHPVSSDHSLCLSKSKRVLDTNTAVEPILDDIFGMCTKSVVFEEASSPQLRVFVDLGEMIRDIVIGPAKLKTN